MSNARNLGNVGARLQQSQSVGLSAGGNIKAVTFQGSGKLLTDILQLTGGNINIPVGSTRQFTKLQSALDSLSSFIFDDTADVQILLDDETFNETDTINLSHDYGDRITIRGVSDLNFKSVLGNPIVSVSGVNTAALSAWIQMDATSDFPAVGDYVVIHAVSGRDACFVMGGAYANKASVPQAFLHDYIINVANNTDLKPVEMHAASPFLLLTDNVKTIITHLTANANPVSLVRTISTLGTYKFSGPTDAPRTAYFFKENTITETSVFENAQPGSRVQIVQMGNDGAYRNTTFTQTTGFYVPFLVTGWPSFKGILTFADGVPTNTWLNQGDVIYAMGQMSTVEAVSSNNKCIIDAPFRTYNAATSSVNLQISTATPFLVKTMFERYRGCHKVIQVDSGTNQVGLEIFDYGFMTNTMTDGLCSRNGTIPLSGFPLPRFGINNIGNAFSVKRNSPYYAAGTDYTSFPAAKILKTKLDFSNISSTALYPALSSGFNCMYVNNAKLKLLDNVAIINTGVQISRAIQIGAGESGELSGPATITLGQKAIGIYGFFTSILNVINSSVCNGSNIGFTCPFYSFKDKFMPSVADVPIQSRASLNYTQNSSGKLQYVAGAGSTVVFSFDRINYVSMTNSLDYNIETVTANHMTFYCRMAGIFNPSIRNNNDLSVNSTNTFVRAYKSGASSYEFNTGDFGYALDYSNQSRGTTIMNFLDSYSGYGRSHGTNVTYVNANLIFSSLANENGFFPLYDSGEIAFFSCNIVSDATNISGKITGLINRGDGGYNRFYFSSYCFRYVNNDADINTGNTFTFMNGKAVIQSGLDTSLRSTFLLNFSARRNIAEFESSPLTLGLNTTTGVFYAAPGTI